MTTIVTIDMGGTGATHAAGAREALSVPSMTDMGSAYTQANAAYTQANTARSDANTTFATINTSFGTINTNYQAAYAQANQAYSAANSANQYAFNSQITVTANTNVAAVPRPLGLNFVNTSTITVSVTNDSGNANIAFTAVGGAAYDQANAAYLQANIALISANQANVIAKDAYAQANTARTTANDAYATANTKLGTSGGSISGDLTISGNLTVQGNATTINVSNLSVNDSIILLSANSAGDAEDIGFIGHITRDSTNTHVGLIRKATENRFYLFDNYEVEPTNNTIDITGNNFRVGNIRLGTINANSFVTAAGLDVTGQANAAYGQANAAYTRANTKLDSAGGTISGNLTVTGTLTVSGNVSSINTQSISSVSNEIILNSNASGAPTLDGKLTINRGSSSNVTLLWNETADKWGWTDNGTTYYYFDDLRQGLSTTNTTFGTINTSYQAAYAQANTARTTANDAYGQANAAYGAANNRVLKAGDTMTGRLYINTSGISLSTNGSSMGLGTHTPTSVNGYSFYTANNTSGGGISFFVNGSDAAWIWSTANDTRIDDQQNRPILFLINSSEKMRIANTGNVGVGTTNPLTKFHLYESGASDLIFRVHPANGSYDSIVELTGQDGNIATEGFQIWYNNSVGDVRLASTYNNDAASIRFHTRTGASKSTSNERLTIAGNGNVGIGSATPAYKLDISTGIRISGGSVANTDATSGLMLDGNYATGQYRHRFRKQDLGGGLPLYIDYSHGTANSYTSIVRFGGGGTYKELTVYGQIEATGAAAFSSSLEVSGNGYFYGNNLRIQGTSPTITFYDTDQLTAYLHCNSNLLYVLRGANGAIEGQWSQYNGQWPFYFNLSNNDAVCGGNFSAIGTITASASDKRLKKNINKIENSVDKIKKINGVYFEWDMDKCASVGFNGNGKDIGVIAQEILEVIPEAIGPAPFDIDENQNSKSGENYLTVKPEKIIPLLIEAIKEQQKQIDELKSRLGV